METTTARQDDTHVLAGDGGDAGVVSANSIQGQSDSRGAPKPTSEKRTSKRSLFASLRRTADLNRTNRTEPTEHTETPLLRFPDYFPQAVLKSAHTPGDRSLVGEAVVALDEAITRAEQEERHSNSALLTLVKAAISNDPSLICKCLGEPDGAYNDEGGPFSLLRSSLQRGEVSAVLPLRVAQRYAHSIVVGEILARTGTNKQRGVVDWREMELFQLDEYSLHKVRWVRMLNIAHCRVESLPQEVGCYLKQVVKLELQFNQLETIPPSLLELPCLCELNLSNNKLRDLPPVPHWSPALTTLDLSHNHLTTIPGDPRAASLHTLNLSHNRLTSVPLCICSLHTLTSLTLSGNRNIQTLPLQMGALSKLTKLELDNMDLLDDPPKKIQAMHQECLQYLRSKLLAPKQHQQMKLMVLGNPGRGKSTLVARLQGKAPIQTSGLEIIPWECKPAIGKRAIHFLIWSFSGEKSFAVHHSFLTERCMCLLVFDITRGEPEVRALRPWLDSLALHAPDSCVMLAGTHLDKVPGDSPNNTTNAVLQMVAKMANEYSTRLHVMEVFGVGIRTGAEELRATIYGCAEEYCVKGEAVVGEATPGKYLQLGKMVSQLQGDILRGEGGPIMEAEEFAALAGKAGVEGQEEVAAATHFLVSVGAILHYDDPNARLDRVYFMDPCWLCDAMLKVVADCEADFFVSKGLMNVSRITLLFDAERFPWKYFRQFLVLLDKFSIALPIDSQRLFVPTALMDTGPGDMFGKRDCYIRYILFDARVTPSFWSRLLSMLLHLVPEIKAKLPNTNPNASPIKPQENGGGDGGAVTWATVEAEIPLMHLVYWRTGIAYWDTRVVMRVESMSGSQHFSREGKEGVAIIVSRNEAGERLLCQAVDIVMVLANDWYPYVQGRARHGNGIHHFAVCSKCLDLHRPLPYEFNLTDCLAHLSKNRGAIECGYGKPSENHMTPLADLVPELLLKDIETKFFISDADFRGGASMGHTPPPSFKEPQLLDFRRRHWSSDPRGDHHLFTEFRREAMLLHRCNHPCLQGFVGMSAPRLMTLVMEKSPLGTLEACLLVKQRPLHRLVLHRMVAEIAAGLQYLHANGIILHGPRTLNDISVWSLEPDCLCHCKLGNFASAMYLTPSGVRRVHLIREGLAPEVAQAMSGGYDSTYLNSSDIFLLGTVLCQMLTRKRRTLKSICAPHLNTSGYYLPLLVQWCHMEDPTQRPSTSDVIDRVCQVSFQSLMQLQTISRDLVIRRACTVTSAQFRKAGLPSCESELWIFSDDNNGTTIDMYHVPTLTKVGGVFLKESIVQSVCVCREHVWVAFRRTSYQGVINLYSINGRALARSIDIGGDGVTCMVPYKERVYCGTLNGCCLAFSEGEGDVCGDRRRRSNCVSEIPLDSILVVQGRLWVTHADLIHFLNPDTLEVEGYATREGASVGMLVMSFDPDLVWSAYLGWGSRLLVWSVDKGVHMYEVSIHQHLKGITSSCEQDMVVTAMTPVIDTVWVGVATGHILVFQGQELLLWFHPYHNHVSLLLCCQASEEDGGGGQTLVVSVGKGLRNPVKGEFPTYGVREGPPGSGALVLWEAYSAATCRQMWMVQERSGTFLKDWNCVNQLVCDGNFKDGKWQAEERRCNGAGEEEVTPALLDEANHYKLTSQDQDASR